MHENLLTVEERIVPSPSPEFSPPEQESIPAEARQVSIRYSLVVGHLGALPARCAGQHRRFPRNTTTRGKPSSACWWGREDDSIPPGRGAITTGYESRRPISFRVRVPAWSTMHAIHASQCRHKSSRHVPARDSNIEHSWCLSLRNKHPIRQEFWMATFCFATYDASPGLLFRRCHPTVSFRRAGWRCDLRKNGHSPGHRNPFSQYPFSMRPVRVELMDRGPEQIYGVPQWVLYHTSRLADASETLHWTRLHWETRLA